MSEDKSPVYLLGAGFNIDAADEAGNPVVTASGLPARYPLVSDLLKLCLGISTLPSGKSIEDLFQDSIDRGEKKPIEALYNLLMEADYYVTPHLKLGGSNEDNVYRTFLLDFPDSPLLTFNNDSLPEILLLAERLWCPKDGYGIPVKTSQKIIRAGASPTSKSLRPVLHLHGSLCVYPSTFGIEKSSKPGTRMLQFDRKPEYLFDPDKLGSCFYPFERIIPGVTYIHTDERVIAPVPNKTNVLKGKFIEAVYQQAVASFRNADKVVVIGYSFNPSDRVSYSKLFDAFNGREILVVSPDADNIVTRLNTEYPRIKWEAKNMTFIDWCHNGYPGVY